MPRDTCHVHAIATTRESCCSLWKEAEHGIKHTMLVLNSVEGKPAFRKQLLQSMWARREIHQGDKPPDFHRKLNVEAMLPILDNSPSDAEFLSMATSLLPYSWTDREKVHLWAPPGVTDLTLFKRMKQLVKALCARIPSSFPGRGWTKCDLAPRWIAKIELIHGSFTPAMRWTLAQLAPLDTRSAGAASLALELPPAPKPKSAPALRPEDCDAVDNALIDAVLEDLVDEAEVVVDYESAKRTTKTITKSDAARIQKQRSRKHCLEWLLRDMVLCDSFGFGVVLVGHARLMGEHLKLAGHEWERQQQVAEVKHQRAQVAGGDDDASNAKPRPFRIFELYKGERDNKL